MRKFTGLFYAIVSELFSHAEKKWEIPVLDH